MRRLLVGMNDDVIGMLSENNDVWSFDYEAAWAKSAGSFDLSPELPRAQLSHVDGSSKRTVQWYFDNLLPEETQRVLLCKQAGIRGDDSFALIQYLGAESAGSLVLVPAGEKLTGSGTIAPLSFPDLSRRIQQLPRTSLSHEAPKRMSVAGAQDKLLVVYKDGQLFEPLGVEPSTHLLKPEHVSEDYTNSVINEFAMMTLASRVGLPTPLVYRLYVPEPVYVVERFDRELVANGKTQRRHIVDACQLLNKPRAYKYSAASLESLAQCIALCTNKARARLELFKWLLFNVLIGNDDIHLKNLSFGISNAGIEICPFYDLLSTAVYHTHAYADERAIWPNLQMMIPLPSATTFAAVNRESLIRAGSALGLTATIAERELKSMTKKISSELDVVFEHIEMANRSVPEAGGLRQAGDLRLLRAIKHIIFRDMLAQVSS